MKNLIAIFLAVMLSGCSLISPRDVGNANMFTLSASGDAKAKHKKQSGLRVNYPTAPSELDTYRIAVTKADGREDFIAGARWGDFLPSLMQTALQDAIGKSGAFRYVTTDESNAEGKHNLSVKIIDCRAVYKTDDAAPLVTMRLFVRLSGPDGRTLKSFVVNKDVTAEHNSMLSIAQAFNAVFDAVTDDIIEKL